MRRILPTQQQAASQGQARSPKPGGVWDPAGRRLQYGPIAEEVVVGGPGIVAAGADGKPQTAVYPLLAPMVLNEVQKQRRTTDAQA
jgi:hypothetical protein